MLPDIVPEVAVIVAVPAATPVARPLAFTVTIPVLDELHVTDAVILCDVPSEYVPVAVNCWVTAVGMLRFIGVTAIEMSVAAELFVPPPPLPPQPTIKTDSNNVVRHAVIFIFNRVSSL